MERLRSELETGTVVYILEFPYSRRSIRKYQIDYFSVVKFHRYIYIYDPQDGLWATEGVRRVWRKHIFLHPHCTLFALLYKKLGI